MRRAVWCIGRHRRPSAVVETGVARRITNRFILEALGANDAGHLWSDDLLPLGRPDLRELVGVGVPGESRSRLSYVEGSSRRRLPGLLKTRSEIDCPSTIAATVRETCCTSLSWRGRRCDRTDSWSLTKST
jgi:hypothetical protein